MILFFVALGLLLRLFLLFRPGHLFGITEYDDGVYFGAALRLTQGIVPYKDYVLVQPPGIAVLFSPLAFLARVIGTSNGMAVVRFITVAVDCANIALVGRLVRSRGRTAVAAGCAVMALYPEAIASSQTLLLEPYLVFFILVGLVLCFESFHFRDSRALVFFGGISFGLAGSIKAWAIIPALAVFVISIFAPRSSHPGKPLPFLTGTVVGFCAVALPFFLLAPKAFVSQTITDQLTRESGARVAMQARLMDITGSNPFTWLVGHSKTVVLVLSLIWLAVLALAVLRTVMDFTSLSVSVIACAILVFIALLWPSDFYYHYAEFEAPFLALTLAAAVSSSQHEWWDFERGGRRVVAFIAMLTVAITALQLFYESSISPAAQPSKLADAAIPAGSCVVTDQVSLLIVSNRFFASSPTCPKMLDPYGTALALSGGKTIDGGAQFNGKVTANWLSALESAQFVWLTPQNTRRVPWTAETKSYFDGHFGLAASFASGAGEIYQRVGG